MKLAIKRKTKWSLSKKSIVCFLLLFPFMKPNGIPNISRTLNNAYNVLMAVSFMAVSGKVLLRRINLNRYIYLLFIFMGWLVLRTFCMGGQTWALLEIMMRFCGISMLIQLYSHKAAILIRSFLTIFELSIYLNFVCLLRYPHGMYVSTQNGNWNNWLLGYDNHWFIVYFGACFILFCYSKIFKKTFRPILLFCVIHISSVMVMSGAILVGLAVIDACLLLRVYKSPVLSYRTTWVAAIIANVMLLFLGSSGIIHFIVYSLLHKSNRTLLARQRIWNTTILAIKDHLIFGLGRLRTADRILLYRNSHASNAHNFFLEILYEGGLVALLLFSSMAVSAGRHLKHHRNSVITGFLLITLLACLVTGSIDSFLEDRGYMFFALLAFAANIEMFAGF